MKDLRENQFTYKDIIDLGFSVQDEHDVVYERTHGYGYSIINLHLTKKIYLDWEKDTKECTLNRIDNNKDCNILAKLEIRDMEHLMEIINFFKD